MKNLIFLVNSQQACLHGDNHLPCLCKKSHQSITSWISWSCPKPRTPEEQGSKDWRNTNTLIDEKIWGKNGEDSLPAALVALLLSGYHMGHKVQDRQFDMEDPVELGFGRESTCCCLATCSRSLVACFLIASIEKLKGQICPAFEREREDHKVFGQRESDVRERERNSETEREVVTWKCY